MPVAVTRTTKRPERPTLSPEKGSELLGMAFVGLALLLTLSFATFQPSDPSLFHELPEAARSRNWIGPIGAQAAAIAFGFFGVSCFLPPLFLMVSGWRRLRRTDAPRIAGRGIGAFLLLVAVPALCQLLGKSLAWRGESLPAGGAFGMVMVSLLDERLNFTGSLLVLSIATFLGTALVVQSTLGQVLSSWRQRVRQVWQNWTLARERRLERREKERARRRVITKHLQRVVEEKQEKQRRGEAAAAASADEPGRGGPLQPLGELNPMIAAGDPGVADIAMLTDGRLDLPLRATVRRGPAELGVRRVTRTEPPRPAAASGAGAGLSPAPRPATGTGTAALPRPPQSATSLPAPGSPVRVIVRRPGMPGATASAGGATAAGSGGALDGALPPLRPDQQPAASAGLGGVALAGLGAVPSGLGAATLAGMGGASSVGLGGAALAGMGGAPAAGLGAAALAGRGAGSLAAAGLDAVSLAGSGAPGGAAGGLPTSAASRHAAGEDASYAGTGRPGDRAAGGAGGYADASGRSDRGAGGAASYASASGQSDRGAGGAASYASASGQSDRTAGGAASYAGASGQSDRAADGSASSAGASGPSSRVAAGGASAYGGPAGSSGADRGGAAGAGRLPALPPSRVAPPRPITQTQLPFAGDVVAGALPPINLLQLGDGKGPMDEAELMRLGEAIRSRSAEFGVDGTIEAISPGPVITVFEFQPAPGVKVSHIVNLQDDLALALKAESVRIERLPGRSTLGLEVPNRERGVIRLGSLLADERFRKAPSPLTMAIGTTIYGEPYYADLATMPHLLVAGATGAGKSVGLQSMITSILYRATRDEVQFIFIDPKRIELGVYADIPHLKAEVVVDPKKAANALRWAVAEMERRYRMLAEVHVRSIAYYNRAICDPEVRERLSLSEDGEESPFTAADLKPMPYYVVIIDELADLMMVSSSDVETSIARLAQMARAVGIHLIVATQRPSVDVLTGTIKANFPCRISYATASRHDSRTILDQVGAEKLLGKGDMLMMPPGSSRVIRLHGAYVSEQETASLVRWLKKQGKPDLDPEVLRAPAESEGRGSDGGDNDDELYDEASRLVVAERQASASFLQRRMRIGFSRAARLIDMMERDGLLGPSQGSKPREVLVKPGYFSEVDDDKRYTGRDEDPDDGD